MKEETRGRPTKDEECHFVEFSEASASYGTDSRLGVAIKEVERFLHSTGRKSKSLLEDVADLRVFGPFVLSKLWQIPVQDVVGIWLVEKNWSRVDRWKRLHKQWDERWEALGGSQLAPGRFITGWRMASMVEAWRLIDECWLEGGGVPSAEEISGAAVVWLEQRGIPVRTLARETAENKTKRELEKIALGWIPRSGLKKVAPPLFPDGFSTWLESVKEKSNPGYEPFSWPAPRQEDLERFERLRAEELNFLRLEYPASRE